MKKVIMMISMIALFAVIGCNTKNGKSADGSEGDSIRVDSVEQQADANSGDSLESESPEASEENDDQAVEAFFTDVFNNRYYEEEGFIHKYCTDKLQKKLREAYEYEGEGYATWKFRSDAQDGPSEEYRLTKFVPEGDGWYRYDFIDMGIPGSHRIKVISHTTPRGGTEIYIDELK